VTHYVITFSASGLHNSRLGLVTYVPGNEAADLAAKEEAALPLPPNAEYSYAGLNRQSSVKATAAAHKLWLAVLPRRTGT